MHRRGYLESFGVARRLRVLAVLAILTAIALPAHAQDTPPNLTVWSDLDAVVASAYAGLANAAVLYPPGAYHFTIGGDYCTFDAGGEVAAITNLCTCSTQFGVTVWQVSVAETQTTPRVWLYLGADGTAFRTNPCPSSYDPLQWVLNVYQHDAPDYLTGDDLTQWYADRDRSRFGFGFTLVNANDWSTLQAAQQAAATNNPPPGTWSPPFPADTNHLVFVDAPRFSTNTLDLWLYSPAAYPMAVLMSTNLINKNWTLLGCFSAVPAFNRWHASAGSAPSAMYRAGAVGVDSDGDGIPDFIETCVLGTDPNCFDTVGSALGDYYRVMIYGLDPLTGSTVGDGISDAWKIANSLNPRDPAVGNEDPDGDGLSNQIEYLLGTNPKIASTFDAANTATLRTATPLSR